MESRTPDSSAQSAQDEVVIVYDGECPFCKQYMGLLRLRASAGSVRLVNARSDDPWVNEIVRRGYDLDQGMIVVIRDQFYYGAEAMHVLGMLSTGTGWFNRLNYYVFRSKPVATVLYPVLRSGRSFLLRIMGRSLINS